MQAQCKPELSQCKLNASPVQPQCKTLAGTQISDFAKRRCRHAGAVGPAFIRRLARWVNGGSGASAGSAQSGAS